MIWFFIQELYTSWTCSTDKFLCANCKQVSLSLQSALAVAFYGGVCWNFNFLQMHNILMIAKQKRNVFYPSCKGIKYMHVINFLRLNATAGLFQTIYFVLLWKALAMNYSLQPCYKSYNIASKGKKCVSPPKILSPCPLWLGLFTFLLSLGQLMLVKWKCKLLCLHRMSCKVVQLNTCACVYYLVFLTQPSYSVCCS